MTPLQGTVWFDASLKERTPLVGLGVVVQAGGAEPREFHHRLERHGWQANTAEVAAAKAAVRLAHEAGVTHVRIIGDSADALSFLRGLLVRPDLPPPKSRATYHALRNFAEVTFLKIPSPSNVRADTLARRAVGLPPKPVWKPTEFNACPLMDPPRDMPRGRAATAAAAAAAAAAQSSRPGPVAAS